MYKIVLHILKSLLHIWQQFDMAHASLTQRILHNSRTLCRCGRGGTFIIAIQRRIIGTQFGKQINQIVEQSGHDIGAIRHKTPY